MGQRVSRTLLFRDNCVNGHDVCDKETMLYYRVDRNGRETYTCRACQAENQKKMRGDYSATKYGTSSMHNLSNTLRGLISARLSVGSEEQLLALYLWLNENIPLPVSNQPVTDEELF